MSLGSQSEWRAVGFVAMATVAGPRPRLAEGSMAVTPRARERDLSRGLESLPVSVGPPSEEPPAFQYSPEHVAGAGEDTDPSEITFPGCNCVTASCVANTCSCLRHGENYNSSCIKYIGSEVDYTRPIFECNAMCCCGEFCQNRVIQRGLQFRLEVFKTVKKGWGLRTLEFIPKGRFVCEYAGEVLCFREACRRIQAQTPEDSNYIIAVREHLYDGQIIETFVDPMNTGNVGRFLNHSCEPNLFMVPVRIDSLVPKLALFAAAAISAGEELSYDYSGRFLNVPLIKREQEMLEEDDVMKKPCYCGAKSCVGFLPYDSSLCYTPGKQTFGKVSQGNSCA
ncbi:histone-lysine N-methyltransferase SETMAR [Malaclemys terrapin pileata]|uniref:histone-lysine N-methyltransferase SETMAR n=1 Tax=Malaclemys terrapin pileata TaxID=2991368 RepID=UPI0023A8A631|nr:histone-lysine N-methyltransferase SETMAR [Malaclemys terrapin pileata]